MRLKASPALKGLKNYNISEYIPLTLHLLACRGHVSGIQQQMSSTSESFTPLLLRMAASGKETPVNLTVFYQLYRSTITYRLEGG